MPMITTYTEPNLEQLLSPYIWHINISPMNENIYDSLSENIMCFQVITSTFFFRKGPWIMDKQISTYRIVSRMHTIHNDYKWVGYKVHLHLEP